MIKYFPKKQREGRQLRSGRPAPTLSCVPEGEWFTTDRGQAFGERAGGGRGGEERGPARAQTAARARPQPGRSGRLWSGRSPGEFEQVQTRAPARRAQDQPVAGRGSPGAEREENARSRARPCLDLWVNEASPVPRNPGKRVWVQADRHREHGSQGRGSERQEKGTGEIWRGRQRHDSVGERDRETPQGEGLRGGPLP